MIRRILILALFLSSLVSCGDPSDYDAWLVEQANAAAPEIPCNGIDDVLQTGGSANGTKGSCPAGYIDAVIGNGCDKKCPGIDADGDGYTSSGVAGDAGLAYTDCDDNDRRVRPGVYVPNSWTSPTGYKLCQTNGSYGSTVLTATTPLCEATGTGVCKYIDCSGGSNSNNGAHGTPYASLGKVSGGSAGTLPSSPYTLQPDDVVYLIGSGTCSTTMTSGAGAAAPSQAIIAELTASGTSGHPITIKRYPGSTATIVTTNAAGLLISGSYYFIQDINIQTARTSVNNAFSFMFVGDHILYRDIYAHDMGGHGDNNDACIYCRHTDDCKVEYSYFKDCNRQTGNVDNIASVLWLDDDATAGECQDHSAKWVTAWNTTADDTNGTMCFKQKHGCDASDVGANKHLVKFSSCLNARRAFWWEGSALRAAHNVIWGAGRATLYVLSDGGGADHGDNEFTDNTVYASKDIMWNRPAYVSTSQKLTIARNVVYDTRATYSSGNNEGGISIDGYGPGTDRTFFETNSSLSSNINCFYNPNRSVVYSYFNSGSTPGGQYTLAQWRTNTGQDAGSFEENFALDSNLQPTSSNCLGLGRDYVAATATSQGSGGSARNPRGLR